MTWSSLLVLHAVVTWFLTGLIWTIQVVHYPLFAAVGAADFVAYEREHCRRIGRIVLPAMLVELAAAIALVGWADAGQRAAAVVGAVLLAVVWGSTFVLQVPCHDRLGLRHDVAVIRRLVATNWLRTFAWSGRGAVAAWLLAA